MSTTLQSLPSAIEASSTLTMTMITLGYSGLLKHSNLPEVPVTCLLLCETQCPNIVSLPKFKYIFIKYFLLYH